MGVEQRTRRPMASMEAPLRAHEPVYARAPAMESPYAFSATDAAGHMRKLEEIEAELIRMAISRYEGHMSEVARRLGIGRSTLYRKLKDLGLEPQEGGEQQTDGPRHATG
jgi:DNA-binding NtrC family response regulator